MIKRMAICFAVLCAFALVSGTRAQTSADVTNIAGTWEMTAEGPQGNTMTQTLTIEQDGSKIKGTIKAQRGELPFEGTVEGNKLNFTAKRSTPRGEMVMEYSGTVDGDSIKGTMKTPRGERPFTAKRSK